MENWKQRRIGRTVVLVLACVAVYAAFLQLLEAQTPANSPQQNVPAPANSQKPKDVNPFPEDSNAVPVLPSKDSAGTPAPDDADYGNVPLPGSDSDPVRSPDEGALSGDESGGSSSSAGLDNLLKPPADENEGKKRRDANAADQPHVEGAKEDESVGGYYLDQKNWRAALSRFESALVLDPENPDVYWGMAESQRHLGDFAGAKANYQKVMEYDPDSKHGKEAKKILVQPEMANAKAVSSTAGSPPPQ